MSPNFLDSKVAGFYVMMDVMYRYCDVFDSCSHCFGLKDVNARLAIFVEVEGADMLFWEANEVAHILEECASFCWVSSATSFSLCRVKGYNFLLGSFPVDGNGVYESEEIVA